MTYDLAVLGGRVYDGSGAPSRRADVGISDGFITKVGRISPREASEVIDARGLVVAPGFIDIHTHSDLPILACPTADNALGQGVTTEVVGNCGSSPAPYVPGTNEDLQRSARNLGLDLTWRTFRGYLRALDRVKPAINLAPLVGHGDLRAAVLGYEARSAEPPEMEALEARLEEALEAGAFGMSSGLIYPPSCYAPAAELIFLARKVAAYGGLYATHIRGEGVNVVAAVQEALDTASAARVALEISHHKATGRRNWGATRTTLPMVETAWARGLAVGMDMYPYAATSTGLAALIPPKAQEGGPKALVDMLQDGDYRKAVARTIMGDRDTWENTIAEAGWDAIVFSSSPTEENRRLQGLTLRQIARRRRGDPLGVLFDLLVEEEGGGDIIVHELNEEEVERVYRHHLTAVGSDGWTSSTQGVLGSRGAHPRAWGTFPRFLSRICLNRGLLGLPEAIWRSTGLPAARMGLKDRGLVRPRFRADLVALDPRRLVDTATYARPKSPARGIPWVVVNGEVAARGGKPTGLRAGAVLKRRPKGRGRT